MSIVLIHHKGVMQREEIIQVEIDVRSWVHWFAQGLMKERGERVSILKCNSIFFKKRIEASATLFITSGLQKTCFSELYIIVMEVKPILYLMFRGQNMMYRIPNIPLSHFLWLTFSYFILYSIYCFGAFVVLRFVLSAVGIILVTDGLRLIM